MKRYVGGHMTYLDDQVRPAMRADLIALLRCLPPSDSIRPHDEDLHAFHDQRLAVTGFAHEAGRRPSVATGRPALRRTGSCPGQ